MFLDQCSDSFSNERVHRSVKTVFGFLCLSLSERFVFNVTCSSFSPLCPWQTHDYCAVRQTTPRWTKQMRTFHVLLAWCLLTGFVCLRRLSDAISSAPSSRVSAVTSSLCEGSRRWAVQPPLSSPATCNRLTITLIGTMLGGGSGDIHQITDVSKHKHTCQNSCPHFCGVRGGGRGDNAARK